MTPCPIPSRGQFTPLVAASTSLKCVIFAVAISLLATRQVHNRLANPVKPSGWRNTPQRPPELDFSSLFFVHDRRHGAPLLRGSTHRDGGFRSHTRAVRDQGAKRYPISPTVPLRRHFAHASYQDIGSPGFGIATRQRLSRSPKESFIFQLSAIGKNKGLIAES